MKSHFDALRWIVLAALVLPAAGGCVCWESWCAPGGHGPIGHGYVGHGYVGHGHHTSGWYGTTMCFGYYPTCWRPWPLECPPCPPFALEPFADEMLKPPLVPQPLLPPDVSPMPDGLLLPPTVQPPLPPNGPLPPSGLLPPGGAVPPNGPMPPNAEPMPEGGASSRRHWSSEIYVSQPDLR